MNLSVAVRAGETYLHVEGGLPVGTYPRLAIYSSDEIVPNIALDSPLWDPGVAWSVHDRMRNRGDEKGRAIALWHRARGSEPTPFAVLTWRTEGTGPFYVFAVGTRNNLNAPLRRQLEAALLAVMLIASKHREAPVVPEWQDTLRWATVHFLHAPHGDAVAPLPRKPGGKRRTGRGRGGGPFALKANTKRRTPGDEQPETNSA